ncbi:exodeoxyribonuclease V subunit alpha [Desulfosarcina sp.]|uniref:exodeoxyribonuclease V subunit alpha n=1 Tax=Desulfosarcina sp. TaxID=2027861 RepID=UPI003569512D
MDNQKEIQRGRLRRFGIDAGHTPTDGLPGLFADLGLSDLDLMTIRDLSQYGPTPVDEGLVGMLGLMFSALAEGSLCLALDTDQLKPSVLPTDDPAVRKIVNGFMDRLDDGCYDTLIDRTGSGDFKPLVLDGTTGRRLLYFQKFHYHEQRLKQRLKSLSRLDGDPPPTDESIQAVTDQLYGAAAVIRQGVDGTPIIKDPIQVEAIRAALSSPLLIVSGGPGTGKTSLLVNILRALVRTGTDPSRIMLAAPTGRAAQRMTETLISNLATIAEPERGDLQLSRLRGSTLHKLLVYRSRTGGFVFGERRYIPADVIVVDEVSMVDVVMMDRLFQAIEPNRTRVILIGDKDQLPSVEAGSVLADMSPAAGGTFASHFVELRHVYRSSGQLLELAQAINAGRPLSLEPIGFDQALTLAARRWAFVAAGDGEAMENHLDRWVAHQYERQKNQQGHSYRDLVQQMVRRMDSPASVDGEYRTDLLNRLFAFAYQCRILTVLRHGRTGSQWVNHRIATRLRQILDPDGNPDDRLFSGALIMITRNDYTRDLFNGDVGLVMRHSDGMVQVYFQRAGGIVAFPAPGLTDWDLAFAMTVHKSQGSEFDDTLLVLPEDADHRLLTREVVYTAATRASRRLIVYGTVAAFQTALKRKIQRQSGLN